jgi:hypothetical protein
VLPCIAVLVHVLGFEGKVKRLEGTGKGCVEGIRYVKLVSSASSKRPRLRANMAVLNYRYGSNRV